MRYKFLYHIRSLLRHEKSWRFGLVKSKGTIFNQTPKRNKGYARGRCNPLFRILNKANINTKKKDSSTNIQNSWPVGISKTCGYYKQLTLASVHFTCSEILFIKYTSVKGKELQKVRVPEWQENVFIQNRHNYIKSVLNHTFTSKIRQLYK